MLCRVWPQRAGSPKSSLSFSCSDSPYGRRAGSMRIWQRSITAGIGSAGSAFSTRSLKFRSGVAEYGAGSTPATVKLRSGTALLLQAREEPSDLLPCGLAAGESMPVGPDDAHKLVTAVHRRQVILARRADAVHEQCLNVRLHLLDRPISRGDRIPGGEEEQRLRRARRTRIHGLHTAERRTVDK